MPAYLLYAQPSGLPFLAGPEADRQRLDQKYGIDLIIPSPVEVDSGWRVGTRHEIEIGRSGKMRSERRIDLHLI